MRSATWIQQCSTYVTEAIGMLTVTSFYALVSVLQSGLQVCAPAVRLHHALRHQARQTLSLAQHNTSLLSPLSQIACTCPENKHQHMQRGQGNRCIYPLPPTSRASHASPKGMCWRSTFSRVSQQPLTSAGLSHGEWLASGLVHFLIVPMAMVKVGSDHSTIHMTSTSTMVSTPATGIHRCIPILGSTSNRL